MLERIRRTPASISTTEADVSSQDDSIPSKSITVQTSVICEKTNAGVPFRVVEQLHKIQNEETVRKVNAQRMRGEIPHDLRGALLDGQLRKQREQRNGADQGKQAVILVEIVCVSRLPEFYVDLLRSKEEPRREHRGANEQAKICPPLFNGETVLSEIRADKIQINQPKYASAVFHSPGVGRELHHREKHGKKDQSGKITLAGQFFNGIVENGNQKEQKDVGSEKPKIAVSR